VVGWSMSAAMTAQLVTDALVMAIWRRGKPDALLRSRKTVTKPRGCLAEVVLTEIIRLAMDVRRFRHRTI
jgi:transposase InsO family protein